MAPASSPIAMGPPTSVPAKRRRKCIATVKDRPTQDAISAFNGMFPTHFSSSDDSSDSSRSGYSTPDYSALSQGLRSPSFSIDDFEAELAADVGCAPQKKQHIEVEGECIGDKTEVQGMTPHAGPWVEFPQEHASQNQALQEPVPAHQEICLPDANDDEDTFINKILSFMGHANIDEPSEINMTRFFSLSSQCASPLQAAPPTPTAKEAWLKQSLETNKNSRRECSGHGVPQSVQAEHTNAERLQHSHRARESKQ